MIKRAVLYARVSTDEQAERGYSLPSQIAACRRYADLHGFSVVGEYQDDLSGTTQIAARPQGARLQAMLDMRAVDAVIVYQVDRLYRDTVELLITARQWLRAGVELHFCDIGKVKNENDILLLIRGWAGSDEREKIAERMKRGKNQKAKSGRVVASGVTPYGYDYEEGLLAPNADAPTVKLIFDWYVNGDHDGTPLTLHEICKRLEAMGVVTPGAGVYRRKRPPTAWNSATINRMISCETYMGTWVWGRTRTVKGVRDHSPSEPAIEVKVPALVDRETWEAAQKRKEYNRHFARRNRQHDYLLSGRIRCSCGRAMAGHTNKGVSGYRCTTASATLRDLNGERRCRIGAVRCVVVEPIVWEYILSFATDKAQFYQLLKEAQKLEMDTLEPKRNRLANIEMLLKQCTKEVGDLAQALKRARGAVGDLLEHQMDEVNARHERLTQERAILVEEIAAGTLSDAQIEAVLKTFERDAIVGIENATLQDKRNVFDILDMRVIVNEGHQASVHCRLPVPVETFELHPTRKCCDGARPRRPGAPDPTSQCSSRDSA